jgi:hypothetical protein
MANERSEASYIRAAARQIRCGSPRMKCLLLYYAICCNSMQKHIRLAKTLEGSSRKLMSRVALRNLVPALFRFFAYSIHYYQLRLMLP